MSPRITPIPPACVSISDQAPLALHTAVVKVLAAAGVAMALTSASDASPTGRSIAIKFGTEQPVAGTTVDSAAGVLNTIKWNNFSGPNQATPQLLTVDLNSGSLASAATIIWSSNNTWSSTGLGEENNTATGENRDLMAGYLDTGAAGGVGVSLSVAGLNSAGFSLGYNVYVYIQGGVNGRGGDYTLGSVTNSHTGDSAFSGTFLEDSDLAGTPAGSNYIVFRNVTGDGFTLTGTPLVGNPARAPINGIEIVANVPEPTSIAALAGGIGVLLGLRRRKEQ